MIEESVAGLLGDVGIAAVPLEVTGKAGLPSVFRVDVMAGASVGAATAAAARLWQARGGPAARASIDLGHVGMAFVSERLFKVAGSELDLWADLSGDYATGDGGWVRLHCNFDHHRDAVLRALLTAPTRDSVAAACGLMPAVAVEEAVLAAGGAAGALRTRSPWAGFPHGPLVRLTRTGEGPVVPLAPAARPLEGVRVLDLTRVIAGPVATRTLAAHGAQVLRIGAAHVPEVPGLVLDMGFGKRSCHLDLRSAEGRAALRELAATADVLIQGYRPGALSGLGFGRDDLKALNPSLVTVDVSAYEPEGPWAGRRGFDSLVQMTTGIAEEGMRFAGSDRPVPLPCQGLDHATGYLGAFAAISGLVHRAESGGSWHGSVSLAGTARWLDSLGRVTPGAGQDPDDDLIAAVNTPHGVLSFVLPPGTASGLLPSWDLAPAIDGSALPVWI
ncbi:CoA transferase [Actinocorallia longicatena]|uniref:CoA transferase n=1 Tax=Actinocorallia longicatena TaxID=111803 RepID=UPI0031E20FF4